MDCHTEGSNWLFVWVCAVLPRNYNTPEEHKWCGCLIFVHRWAFENSLFAYNGNNAGFLPAMNDF